VLSACRRILKPGGRLAFFTIQPTPGLTGNDRRRANAAGPGSGAVRTSYQSMMRSAGFENISATDVTAEYRATQQRWIDTGVRHETSLRTSMGDEMYDDRLDSRRRTLAGLDEGLLARFLYTARRPIMN
jgi:hypothetical protein